MATKPISQRNPSHRTTKLTKHPKKLCSKSLGKISNQPMDPSEPQSLPPYLNIRSRNDHLPSYSTVDLKLVSHESRTSKGQQPAAFVPGESLSATAE